MTVFVWAKQSPIFRMYWTLTAYPAGTQRLYNVGLREYLRYVIYGRLCIVVKTFVNERCFTYVYLTFVKRFQITSKFLITLTLMKHFTFVYKLNIYFNRDIWNRSVKLTQPKPNTEEIICSSGVGHCDVFWYRS